MRRSSIIELSWGAAGHTLPRVQTRPHDRHDHRGQCPRQCPHSSLFLGHVCSEMIVRHLDSWCTADNALIDPWPLCSDMIVGHLCACVGENRYTHCTQYQRNYEVRNMYSERYVALLLVSAINTRSRNCFMLRWNYIDQRAAEGITRLVKSEIYHGVTWPDVALSNSSQLSNMGMRSSDNL